MKVIIKDKSELERFLQSKARDLETELDISSMGLTALPDAIFTLRNLRALWANDNQIKIIPPEISKVAGSLTHLELTHNQISTLPDSIGTLANLNHLDVSQNALTLISQEIGKCSSLRLLRVSNNAGLKVLPIEIGNIIGMQTLDASNCIIEILPQAFEKLINLESLILSNNKISTIPLCLPGFILISELWLDNNLLSDTLKKVIVKMFPNLAESKRLKL